MPSSTSLHLVLTARRWPRQGGVGQDGVVGGCKVTTALGKRLSPHRREWQQALRIGHSPHGPELQGLSILLWARQKRNSPFWPASWGLGLPSALAPPVMWWWPCDSKQNVGGGHLTGDGDTATQDRYKKGYVVSQPRLGAGRGARAEARPGKRAGKGGLLPFQELGPGREAGVVCGMTDGGCSSFIFQKWRLIQGHDQAMVHSRPQPLSQRNLLLSTRTPI